MCKRTSSEARGSGESSVVDNFAKNNRWTLNTLPIIVFFCCFLILEEEFRYYRTFESKSLEFLGCELKKKFKINILIWVVILFKWRYQDDARSIHESFIRVLSLLNKYDFVENSIMQQPGMSEAYYGDYFMRPYFKKLLASSA